ncbi:unnamed protein product, partial [Rotaria magnacalcarata]
MMSPYPTLKPAMHCCVHQQQYQPLYQSSPMIFSPIEDVPPIEAICGNNLMITINRMVDNKQISIKELNNDDLIFIENIGHGLFGSIYLAE